jgi:uncharacterized phage-associated protein
MKTYCFSCDNDVEITIIEKEVESKINDVIFSHLAKIPYCNKCEEEVYIAEISDENIKCANDKYREIIGLISVREIEELLEQYDIGKKPLAQLLGWGEATVIRYLDGFTPRRIYSDQLRELRNPHNMLKLFEANKNNLTEIAQRKLYKRICYLIETVGQTQDAGVINVAKFFLSKIDVEAEEIITPLKLQKLIYYAQAWLLVFLDRSFFDEDFQAWVHGPVVPNLYFEFKKHGYCSIPKATNFDKTVFKSDELQILEMVYDVYGRYDAKHLEHLTHRESPWTEARRGYEPDEKCTHIITKTSMLQYYKWIKDEFNIQATCDLKKYVANL